jgi:predicted component of type VI protein secretion system
MNRDDAVHRTPLEIRIMTMNDKGRFRIATFGMIS